MVGFGFGVWQFDVLWHTNHALYNIEQRHSFNRGKRKSFFGEPSFQQGERGRSVGCKGDLAHDPRAQTLVRAALDDVERF